MRCIFCKRNSDTSKSVEHILPESLGNTKHVLPVGVACDSCNNYFATKIEKPFLESPSIVALRFHQAIPNKRGRIPPLTGILDPGFPVVAHRYSEGPFVGSLEVGPDALKQLLSSDQGRVLLPMGGEPPTDMIVSRFLAKAALEAMALRLVSHPEGLEYLVDESQLDLIRNHARRGETRNWPYLARRIYDPNKPWNNGIDAPFQVVHEHDFLQTEAGEMYFIVALFGLELALNLGGPVVEGYIQWLNQHNHVSPLYWGKNGNIFST